MFFEHCAFYQGREHPLVSFVQGATAQNLFLEKENPMHPKYKGPWALIMWLSILGAMITLACFQPDTGASTLAKQPETIPFVSNDINMCGKNGVMIYDSQTKVVELYFDGDIEPTFTIQPNKTTNIDLKDVGNVRLATLESLSVWCP